MINVEWAEWERDWRGGLKAEDWRLKCSELRTPIFGSEEQRDKAPPLAEPVPLDGLFKHPQGRRGTLDEGS